MHEALALLVDLEPEHLQSLLAAGSERELHREDVVIAEGEHPEHLFIVLEGLFEVRLDAAAGHRLGVLGPGELLGEVSWLEQRSASATVRTVEDGVLLALPRARLQQLCDDNPALGLALHRALGRVLARRLRERSDELALRTMEPTTVEGLGPWKQLSPAIDQLKGLMQQAEQATHGKDAVPVEQFVDVTHQGLGGLCDLLTEHLGEASGIDPNLADEVGALARRELHPYMLLTRIVERIYTKPRGYAGDFLTIEWMYANEVATASTAGRLIDTAFLERPAARAVRNRRGLLAGEIANAVKQGGQVTSLACGPAEELFDVFASLDDKSVLKATCLDIDLQALALVSDRRDREGLARQMRLEQANLVYMATGRAQLDLEPQQLIYSIGLIDYFQDRFVIALLDWIHERLAPGGKVVLGNFHPSNPDKALMDHILDWKLIHRDEADMNRIFEASSFAAPCDEIRFEEAGVNLFAMGVRR